MKQLSHQIEKRLISANPLRLGLHGFTLFLAVFVLPIGINAEIFQKTATKYQKVQVRLEVRGKVVSTPDDSADEEQDSKGANVVPMQVKAAFGYEELVQISESGIRSVRYYDQAQADIEINSQKELSKLADSNRYVLFNRVIKKSVVDRVALASLQGRLTQRQWQLIDVPANSMIADQLIAGQTLAKGSAWELEADLLADFLLLDSVDESDVEFKVHSVEADQVTVSVFGGVIGDSDDVSCNLRVNGTLVVGRQTRRVEKIELTLRQKKDEGQIGPGYDALIKIQVDITPSKSPNRLTKSNIAEIRGQRSISSDLIVESPQKTIQFIHDRRWRMIINSTELMILRLLDDGQVLGQCNVIPMPRLPAADAYKLEDFKKNVSEAVDEEGQIVDAKARKTRSGNLIYEVEVSGEQSGVPLTWLYYHVAQLNGERAMCIVTTETDLVDSIRGAELTMIESLLIRSPKEASEARKAESSIQSR